METEVTKSMKQESRHFSDEMLKRNECEKVGISIDYINESPPYIPFTGNKVYYNILLDDRAGLRSAYEILYKAKERIKNEAL